MNVQIGLNPLLVKRSGCVSNHSLREIGSLLLNEHNGRALSNGITTCLNPLLVKRSGCFSNHSLWEIGSLLLNQMFKLKKLLNKKCLNPLKSGHLYNTIIKTKWILIPFLWSVSGCFSNHSLWEIGSLLLN